MKVKISFVLRAVASIFLGYYLFELIVKEEIGRQGYLGMLLGFLTLLIGFLVERRK